MRHINDVLRDLVLGNKLAALPADKLPTLSAWNRFMSWDEKHMTISHESITLTTPDAPVIFASLHGISCSVCAPSTMTESEVAEFANQDHPWPGLDGRWVVVDKSKLGLGTPTPNPCNQVDGRKHWFLLSDELAEPL